MCITNATGNHTWCTAELATVPTLNVICGMLLDLQPPMFGGYNSICLSLIRSNNQIDMRPK